MAILNIVLIANTDYEEKQSSQMAKELILKKAFLSKKWWSQDLPGKITIADKKFSNVRM